MKRDRYSGKIINERYELIRLIDEGGMGAVYLGRDIRLGRKAAVKFLHSELTAGEASVKRFYREAQAASAVYHPNIISVFDVGVSEWGEPYLVMEYLAGETLGSLLKRKRIFDTATALGVLEPALRGLGAAHEQNIIHRDLKPENIFVVQIPDGAPIIKLIDFGISKFSETDQPQLTRTGALLGTPSYMSPEQARGKGEFDHRADLYSMGVILYLMLSGEHPFVGQSYNDLIFNILTEPARDPFKVNPAFPVDVAPIVTKLLEKDPEKRYPDCKAVLAALEGLAAYADRQNALVELSKNMLSKNFATGDLGDGEFLSPAKEPEDLAATVFAKTGSDEAQSNHVNAPTTPAIPRAKELSSEDEKQKREASKSEEANELSWDMIPSHLPPPHRRRDDRRSPWTVVLILFLMFAAGVGVVFGLDLFYAKDPTAPDNGLPPAVDTGDEPVVMSDTVPKHDGHSDTTLNTALTDKKVDTASDTDGTASDTVETDSDAPHSSDEAAASGAEKAEVSAPPTATPSKGDADAQGASKSGSSGRTEKTGGASGPSKSPTKLPVADEEDEEDLPPAPFESPSKPLTPQRIDRLVDAKSKRIQNCYDMARLAEPGMEGTLVLVVGMAGTEVQVKVQKNETTAYLASCVQRVIRSIKPPPNDGTLVEILKEFEFRTAD